MAGDVKQNSLKVADVSLQKEGKSSGRGMFGRCSSEMTGIFNGDSRAC